MERNQVTGLILISLLLLIYFQFFAPEPPVLEKEPITEQTIKRGEAAMPRQPQEIDDEKLEQLGDLAIGAQGEEKDVVIENKNVKITLSTKGGKVKEVLLKDYLTYDKEPLVLLDEQSSQIDLNVHTASGEVNLADLYFETTAQNILVGENDTASVSFTLALADGQYIRHTYSLAGGGFRLGYDLDMQGMDNIIRDENIAFNWTNHLKRLERTVEVCRESTTVNFYTKAGEFDHLKETSMDPEEEVINEPIYWVALKQKFFTSAIIANEGFRNGRVSKDTPQQETEIVKNAHIALNIPLSDIKEGRGNFSYYFGPNNYQILKKVAPEFHQNVYLGWPVINLFNKYLIVPIFNFLENYIANYGIIIIILVLIIKLLLSPLSYKAYMSMAKTRVLKPELDEIKAQHGDDMAKIQSDQMKLYQRVGINPLSGCIPVLLQMPFLLAMFNFFPNSIELRQESFLWADDLSTYDAFINLPFHIPLYGSHVSLFTILMTASTILITWSNNQMSSVQGPMKSMGYIMPVVFMFILNSFSAGLTFYYFVSNIVTFGQQAIIKLFVDEDKIKKILEENKKRNQNKKKSKFQQRLEDALKASEEMKKSTQTGKKPGKK
jgi:YidC/Oxa1 family membrane protein insertase